MNKPLPEELLSSLDVLDSEDIDLVTDYVRALKEKRERLADRKKLMSLAGSIPKDEMEQIRAAIEEGCERIDHEGW